MLFLVHTKARQCADVHVIHCVMLSLSLDTCTSRALQLQHSHSNTEPFFTQSVCNILSIDNSALRRVAALLPGQVPGVPIYAQGFERHHRQIRRGGCQCLCSGVGAREDAADEGLAGAGCECVRSALGAAHQLACAGSSSIVRVLAARLVVPCAACGLRSCTQFLSNVDHWMLSAAN